MLEELDDLLLIAPNRRQLAKFDFGAGLLEFTLEVHYYPIDGRLQIHFTARRWSRIQQTGVDQDVDNELLHLAGRREDELNKLVRFPFEPPFVALREQLRERCNSAEGSLQVMGRRIGEVLKLFVRGARSSQLGFQLGDSFLQCLDSRLRFRHPPAPEL